MILPTSLVLRISTAHIKPDTSKLLENGAHPQVVCMQGNPGFLIDADAHEAAIFRLRGQTDLADVMAFALRNNCHYVWLHPDFDEVGDLPDYEWA